MGLTDDQLQKRRQGVTASEIASIMGLSPWGSAQAVWADKRGYAGPTVETEAMARGNELELPILNMMANRHKLTIIKTGTEQETIVSPANPKVIATPDGIVLNARGNPGAVAEAKSPGRSSGRHWVDPKENPHGVPIYYYPQVQYQMGALGLPMAWVAALVYGDLYVYRVPFNQSLFDQMVAFVEQWWVDYVVADMPPPPNDSKASWAWVNEYYAQQTDNIIALDGDKAESLDQLVTRYNEAKDREKAAQDEKKAVEAKIKSAIGESQGLATNYWTCTWKTGKPSRSLDLERLAKKIDLESYYKEKPRRYFHVKQNKKGGNDDQ